MSALGERVLVLHLTDPEALGVLAAAGLDPVCLPTERLRPVVAWALDYYHRSGRVFAPSPEALQSEPGFLDVLEERAIDLTDAPGDSMEWAITDLQGSYALDRVGRFNREFASEMAHAESGERVEVVANAVTQLVDLSVTLEARYNAVEACDGLTERMVAYREREADQGAVRGMRLHLPMIDDHMLGIHPGELAVLAAPPKAGKSLFGCAVALREWQSGRNVVMFSLENSIEMTYDRIACQANAVSQQAWQQGRCSSAEIDRVTQWLAEIGGYDQKLWVLQPDAGARSVAHMVRSAQMRGADSLVIDQLTFVEPRDQRAARYLQLREIVHDLKTMISSARDRLPCLLLHQISREGIKHADRVGSLEMHHLAESSEVERTADFVIGLYQSRDERAMMVARLSLLAARRTDLAVWGMSWNFDTGQFHAVGRR